MFLIILATVHLFFQCKSVVICTSGDCDINCNSVNCDTVICTNKASSCTINCDDGQCKNSEFYLAAYNHNTINCDENDFCDQLNLQCGEYDFPPLGYTDGDFAGAIHECSLVLLNNAKPNNVYMQCHHNVAICQCTGNGCDQIHKLFDVELINKDDENLSQSSSDKNDSEFICILLFIFIGILLMSFAIFCCIRIQHVMRRKMIEMQLDRQSHNVCRNESEQILESDEEQRSKQPYIVYNSVLSNSMGTVPTIPIQNMDRINVCNSDSDSSSLLDEQDVDR